VSNYIVNSYVRLRKLSKDEEAQNKSHTYTSARTLLGILRLAQALARLRWSDFVEQIDVDEALRLMDCSKESLMDENEDEHETDRSVISRIYRLILSMARSEDGDDMDVDSDDEDSGVLSMTDIRARVLGAGYTEAQLMETIVAVSSLFTHRNSYAQISCFSMKIWTIGFVSHMALNCDSLDLASLLVNNGLDDPRVGQ